MSNIIQGMSANTVFTAGPRAHAVDADDTPRSASPSSILRLIEEAEAAGSAGIKRNHDVSVNNWCIQADVHCVCQFDYLDGVTALTPTGTEEQGYHTTRNIAQLLTRHDGDVNELQNEVNEMELEIVHTYHQLKETRFRLEKALEKRRALNKLRLALRKFYISRYLV